MTDTDREETIEHLGELDDVSGCAEFWEYMSDVRVEPDDE